MTTCWNSDANATSVNTDADEADEWMEIYLASMISQAMKNLIFFVNAKDRIYNRIFQTNESNFTIAWTNNSFWRRYNKCRAQ